MLLFLTRRLLIAVPTIILISIFVFALQKLLPGDPLLVLAGEERDPAVLELLREKYRLNDPIVVQYFTWVTNALTGDLGISLRTNQPVTELMMQKLPVTLQLAAMSMIFALVIGVPTGILSAYKKDTVTDYIANIVALSGLSIPNFWLGIMLILLVSVKWQLLPASGYVPLSEDVGQSIRTMLMPSFVLGTALAATMMRHTRSAMLGVLSADYVRTARAKGLTERRVVLKHAFRNALTPIVTLTALLFGELVACCRVDRADFHHPRLWQNGGRCRVQPRLRRGAGHRSGDRCGLHLYEPRGGCLVLYSEPATERAVR